MGLVLESPLWINKWLCLVFFIKRLFEKHYFFRFTRHLIYVCTKYQYHIRYQPKFYLLSVSERKLSVSNITIIPIIPPSHFLDYYKLIRCEFIWKKINKYNLDFAKTILYNIIFLHLSKFKWNKHNKNY